MRTSVRGLGILCLMLSAGCESEPLAGVALARPRSALMETGYVVAPGLSTLQYSIGDGPRALVFGGSPALRVHRVRTSSLIDIEFAGAGPQDASRFFRDNPLPGPNGVTIEVENPTGRPQHLSVTSPEDHRKP